MKLLKKLFPYFFASAPRKYYLLIHFFQNEKFIGQCVHEVPEDITVIAGTIVRIDPRTDRNILSHREWFEKSKTLQIWRPTLKEGYSNDTDIRVMQVFSL